MTVPSFVGAGSGITVTGTSGTFSKTGCIAGNLIVAVAVVNGTQTAGFTNATNIEAIDGTDSSISSAPGGPFGIGAGGALGNQTIAYGRVMANGTCSVDANVTSDDMIARMYELQDVVGTLGAATIIVDNSAAGNGMRQGIGTSTTITALNPAVTTNGSDRLALAFVAVVANLALGDFTGESGADWTEAIAEYSDTPASMSLHTAPMPSATSISTGGTITIGSSVGWVADTTALIGAVAEKETFYATRRAVASLRR